MKLDLSKKLIFVGASFMIISSFLVIYFKAPMEYVAGGGVFAALVVTIQHYLEKK